MKVEDKEMVLAEFESKAKKKFSCDDMEAAWDYAYDILEEIDDEHGDLKDYEEDEGERWFDWVIDECIEKFLL